VEYRSFQYDGAVQWEFWRVAGRHRVAIIHHKEGSAHMRTLGNGATFRWGTLLGWGALAGLIGGIVMAMFMMVVTALTGMGFLAPLYAIAATFNSPWAMTKGFDPVPVVIGLMVHMMNSIIFGLIFALLLGWIAPRALALPVSAVAGMVWGLIVLGVNQLLVLPALDRPMLTATNGVFGWWLIAHLMFGLALGAIVGATVGRSARIAGHAVGHQAV
jgi:hypothetical protein